METIIPDDVQQLINNKQDGYKYRERRQQDWLENYSLGRDKVIINRLTQRQSVNIPLIKMAIQTLLSQIDDMPNLYFENLDNDKEAEIFKNEYWKEMVREHRMGLQDIIDKRQVFYFGRSFDQWQIVDGKVKMTVQDPEDILIQRYCDPFNIHSSRFLIHDHIFVPLKVLEMNPDYDKTALADLKKWLGTNDGLIAVADNESSLSQKNLKMSQMGLSDVDSPILGETYVELSLHFVYDQQEGNDYEEIFLKVVAQDYRIIFNKPLEQVIGVTKDHYFRNHYPYVSWADQLERQDFWSDAVADSLRQLNKVLNAWYSQEVESRTLASLGMNYWDGTVPGAENFTPQTFQPQAFGWYKVPGDPNKLIKKVDIAPLNSNLDAMKFLIEIGEKVSGATATQQGATEQRQITLGEVKLALGKAEERVNSMEKFYIPAWEQRGEMFSKLIEAGADKLDAVMIYKKGRNTDNIYSREISPNDWQTPLGYRCRVWSQKDKDNQDEMTLQKQAAVKQNMPDNPVVDDVYKRKLLEFGGYTPDQINEAMKYEQEKRNALMMQAQQAQAMGTPLPEGLPTQPGIAPQLPQPQQQLGAGGIQ